MARLSERVRLAVLSDLRATVGTPDGSYRKIAKRHGVGEASVRRIAAAAGIDAADEARVRTKNATTVLALSNAERRERLAKQFLDVAEQAIREMSESYTVFNFGGKDNTFEARTLPAPPTGDKRNLIIVAATAVDKHKVLDTYDSAVNGAAAVDAWLQGMIGSSDGG